MRITALCEADRRRSVDVDEPVVLRCEISDPNAQVTWYKDGIELREAAGQDIHAEGSVRTLAFPSVQLSHAGMYSCRTTDDEMQFHVDVKGDFHVLSMNVEFKKCMTDTFSSKVIKHRCHWRTPNSVSSLLHLI